MSDYIAEWRRGNNCSTARHQKDQQFLKWLYERFIRKHGEVLSVCDVFRHGHQGHPFPKHPQTRYTEFIGSKAFRNKKWNPGVIRQIEPPLELK